MSQGELYKYAVEFVRDRYRYEVDKISPRKFLGCPTENRQFKQMNKDIDKLIASAISGQASEEERKELSKWLEDPGKREVYDQLKNIWTKKLPEQKLLKSDEIKENIWNRAVNEKNNLVSLRWIIKVAAIFILSLSTGIFFWKSYQSLDTPPKTAQIETIKKTNPAGVKSLITLPDGTRVHLNSESTLIFKKDYNNSQRIVELQGEAFFDVAKDTLRPFKVRSGNITTTAVGTAFNVRAYSDETDVQIALEEGIVQVEKQQSTDGYNDQFILRPGEYVAFNSDSDVGKGIYSPEKVLGWRDNILIFEEADFGTVIKKLERWYGVRFNYSGELPHWRFNGKFKNENLENILTTLSYSEKFDYSIDDKIVTLSL